jgi:hypothetical protein
MIPENPTRAESKAVMIAYCRRDPQIGEIYDITASGVTERWVMSGITWERETINTIRGAIMLPLPPKMTFEFKVLSQNMPVTIAHRMESNMQVRASQWRYWQEQGIPEYVGCLDLYDPSCVAFLSPRVEFLNEGEQRGITAEL